MALIKSISGIRGTIGGPVGDNLTPVDIVNFTYAYCKCLRDVTEAHGGVIYLASHCGRDAMVGVALFLSKLAHNGMTVSEYKATATFKDKKISSEKFREL